MSSIYGEFRTALDAVLQDMTGRISACNDAAKKQTGSAIYEHLIARVKSDDSMREKCRKRNLPETPASALREVRDAVGLRIVCRFVDDIFRNVEGIRRMDGVTVVEEKDYVRHAKPNGYRSYHMILDVEEPFADVDGQIPGHYFVEIQLRTIAMDSWASLEHEMKYKHDIKNPELIVRELKRCADELASCDLSMQTIRNLIRAEH